MVIGRYLGEDAGHLSLIPDEFGFSSTPRQTAADDTAPRPVFARRSSGLGKDTEEGEHRDSQHGMEQVSDGQDVLREERLG